MDEVTKIDISDELRQTAGYLISGTIADGEVSTFMLTDAADEIDSLRSRLAAQSAAPVGEPVAWQACDTRYAVVNGIVTVQKTTVDACGEGRVAGTCIDGCCLEQDDPDCPYCSHRCDVCNPAKPKKPQTSSIGT